MILASNISANNTPSISSTHCRNTTRSLLTGRGRNTQALILNGTTNPAPANSPWKTTSDNSFSDMAIQRHANHSNHPTSIAKSYTGQASKIHYRKTPPPAYIPLASNASKELSENYYTMPEQSTTNSSPISAPSDLKKPGPPKPLTKRSTTYWSTHIYRHEIGSASCL